MRKLQRGAARSEQAKWRVAVAGFSLAAGLVGAQDWPAWGDSDPGRNMYSPAKGLPTKFNPGKIKEGTEEIDPHSTENVKWVAKLGSQSYGNTVVAGGKVFVGTNNDSPREPQHKGD